MRLSFGRALWIVLGLGAAVRLVLAFTTYGVQFDINSVEEVRAALADTPLQVYSIVNSGVVGDLQFDRWPYPSGYFPFVGIAAKANDWTGIAFHGLIQLPPIAADIAIAWIVQDFLRGRGAGERLRLAAAALVALGPSFGLISGYHGQMDSVAILPAVAALALWDRLPPDRRPLVCGALIGAGAAIKTVPMLMVLALLPSTTLRDGARLLAAAVAVPILAMAPFALSDPDGVAGILDYRGAPGLGGFGLLVQPGLAASWLAQDPIVFTGFSTFVYEQGARITLVAVIALALFLLRYRPAPLEAAVLLWLVVYAFSPNFFFQYLIWGLPFFLMAGYVRAVAILQGVVLVPALIAYSAPISAADTAALVYVPIMIGVWIAAAAGAFVLGRRIVARARGEGGESRAPGLVPALRFGES